MVDPRPNEPAKPVYCAHCQAVIPEGQRACVCCGEPIARGGLFSRLLQRFFEWALRKGWVKMDGLPAGGQLATKRQVVKSWDELPPEVKQQIEEAQRTGRTVIRIQDETTGEDRTFNSWDEVPEHLKANIPPEFREQMAAELEAAKEQGDFGPIDVNEGITERIVGFNVERRYLGKFPREDGDSRGPSRPT